VPSPPGWWDFQALPVVGVVFLLILFYLIGTKATKYGHEIKKMRDADASKDSVRGHNQVLACSIIAVVCALAHAILCGKERKIDFNDEYLASALYCGIIAHYACCCADTLASEMGILAEQLPFLITSPWKRVPAGTNGGITLMGLLWSGVGGALIGAGAVACDIVSGIEVRSFEVISFGILCGLLGSILDSILGAVLQASYYDVDKKLVFSGGADEITSSCKHICGMDVLTNVQVNLVSVLLTTVLGGIVIGPILIP